MDGEFPTEVKGTHHSVTNSLYPGSICYFPLSEKVKKENVKKIRLQAEVSVPLVKHFPL